MDYSENTEEFNSAAADQLYQLLLDLNEKGTSDIRIDPRSLLSSDVDTIAAMNRSGALEREAKDILRVFTNAPVTPIFRENTSNSDECALVPRYPLNTSNEANSFKMDAWKNELLLNSFRNDSVADQLMHFINIKINANGGFRVSGLESINNEIKEILKELGNYIADETAKVTKINGIEIREIFEDGTRKMEIEKPTGIIKFTANKNPIDVLSEIYCMEETDDNKKIFKVPQFEDFVVSPGDNPVTVFKLLTGYDLTDFYKNPSETISTTIVDVPAIEYNITENKENVEVKNTSSKGKRHKKNKRKSKKKK